MIRHALRSLGTSREDTVFIAGSALRRARLHRHPLKPLGEGARGETHHRRRTVTDHFCPCTDLTCPRNPHSHRAKRHTCDLCIRHCLRVGEVPACFFKAVNADNSAQTDYSYAGFAAYVREHTGR